MTRTLLNSGVLIAAARARKAERARALGLMRDSNGVFVTSPFLELEVLPHSQRLNQALDVAAYREFFSGCERLDDLTAIVEESEHVLLREAHKLADGVHLATCRLMGVDELITTEGPGKPLRRTRLVKVVPLL